MIRRGACSLSGSHLGSTNGQFPLSRPVPKLPSSDCYQPLRYLQLNRLFDFEPAASSSLGAPNDVNNNQPPHFRLQENNYSSGDDEHRFDDTASSLCKQAIDSIPTTHTNSRTTRSTRLDSQPSHPVPQATLPSSPPMTTLPLHLGFNIQP